MAKRLPRNVAQIYRSAPLPHRATMLTMRERILSIVPAAEEVVSYGMPAFRVNGSIVAGVLANRKHVGYYPFSGSVLKLFERELRGYSQTKSALHVPVDQPLSRTMLKKLVSARISQCPVKNGSIDSKRFAARDGAWRALGIAAPARRGLVNADIIRLRDLTKLREADVMKIHGIGGNAMAVLRREMKRSGLRFRASR